MKKDMDAAYGDTSHIQLFRKKLIILYVSLILKFVTATAGRVTL